MTCQRRQQTNNIDSVFVKRTNERAAVGDNGIIYRHYLLSEQLFVVFGGQVEVAVEDDSQNASACS